MPVVRDEEASGVPAIAHAENAAAIALRVVPTNTEVVPFHARVVAHTLRVVSFARGAGPHAIRMLAIRFRGVSHARED